MPVVGQRGGGDGVADLGRGAQRHRIDRHIAFGEFVDVVEVRHALDPVGRAADGRDQLEGRVACDGGDMLVMGDLAHADQREADRVGHRYQRAFST